MSFDHLYGLWQDGQRRLQATEPPLRDVLERVRDALVDELRRRLGGHFTADELAALYLEQGTDWCFDVAVRVAPRDPRAWDIATVGGAAFARYVREASDFAGGTRVRRRDDEE